MECGWSRIARDLNKDTIFTSVILATEGKISYIYIGCIVNQCKKSIYKTSVNQTNRIVRKYKIVVFLIIRRLD